jgi:hypothetical protein
VIGSLTIAHIKEVIATKKTKAATTHKLQLISKSATDALINIFEGVLRCIV